MATFPDNIFDNPRFIGLWTYRPYGGTRKYCASVVVKGTVQETEMYDSWQDAVQGAGEILQLTEP